MDETFKNLCLATVNVGAILKANEIDERLLTKDRLNVLFHNASVLEKLYECPEATAWLTKIDEFLRLRNEENYKAKLLPDRVLATLLSGNLSGEAGLRVVSEYGEVMGVERLESAAMQLCAGYEVQKMLKSVFHEGHCSSEDIAAVLLLDNWTRSREVGEQIANSVQQMLTDGKLSVLVSLLALTVDLPEGQNIQKAVSEVVVSWLQTNFDIATRTVLFSNSKTLEILIFTYSSFVKFLFEMLRLSETFLSQPSDNEDIWIVSSENCFDYEQCLNIIRSLAKAGFRPAVTAFVRSGVAKNLRLWHCVENDLLEECRSENC
ncbi:hypothetical protein AAG570_003027 [Ranatra chinensis]|uniref:Uncharacterized protein n=1 Tax=Ranatra chinensis TaxID=642074 RepID=A0ABD0Y5N4_9HEMI